MKLSDSLQHNIAVIKSALSSDDIAFYDFKIKDVKATLIYFDTLSDKNTVGELILKPLSEYRKEVTFDGVKSCIFSPTLSVIEDFTEVIDSVLDGHTVLLYDGLKKAFSVDIKNVEKRPIQEPPTATVLKGPREGFVENLQSNLCLIRKKIKSDKLTVEYTNKGQYSSTKIALVYIKGIVKPNLLKSVKEKLKEYSLDAVIDSSYVAKIITENKGSLFKQIGTTEKPDIMCAKILEGRMAILVDGSPIALTIPYLLVEDFQSAEDYYSSVYHANLSRLLRVTAVLLSVLLPALYVSAQIYHLQLIPLSFLLTIENSIKGIPLSPGTEMLLTLIIFEILNEASVRMPRYMGMVVSIVGGLVLGETAVNAGIITPPALMIIAFSAICLYTVPDLEQVLSIIRVIYLIIAGTIGGYGIILASCFLFIYLTSKEFFETPLLAPFSPLIVQDLKDSVFKNILVGTDKRPLVLGSKNRIRIKKVQ